MKDAKKRVIRWVKNILPPIVLKLVKKHKDSYGCFGNYSSWQEALAASDGYDSSVILEKVKNAVLQVKSGARKVERDSVLLDDLEPSFPFLAGLLSCAARNKGELSVLDFGGSLGTSYFQYRSLLAGLSRLQWNIVEQEHFVKCGKDGIEDDCLKFFFSVDECLERANPQLLLLSSVLQYLERPYEFLEKMVGHAFPFILIERTAFAPNDHQERLTVQKVPPDIYPASYPAWFLKMDRFQAIMNPYDLLFEFNASEADTEWAKIDARFKGFFFARKPSYEKK